MSYESIFFCGSDVNSTHAISLGTRGLVFILHRLRLTDANLLLFCGHLERSSLLVSVSVGVSCTGKVSSDALNHVSVHFWELLIRGLIIGQPPNGRPNGFEVRVLKSSQWYESEVAGSYGSDVRYQARQWGWDYRRPQLEEEDAINNVNPTPQHHVSTREVAPRKTSTLYTSLHGIDFRVVDTFGLVIYEQTQNQARQNSVSWIPLTT